MAEKKTAKKPGIKGLLTALIEKHKAGGPTETNVYWICLRPCAIAKLPDEQHRIKVSNGLVKRLLRGLGHGYRKQSKELATGGYAQRNQQFNVICMMVLVMGLKSPVLSMDCKKKERLGNLYRGGNAFAPRPSKYMTTIMDISPKGRSSPMVFMICRPTKGTFPLAQAARLPGSQRIIYCGGGLGTASTCARMQKTFCCCAVRAGPTPTGTMFLNTSS